MENSLQNDANTIKIDGQFLERLDQFVVARNFENRDALVNALLKRWLERADNAAYAAIYTRPILNEELTAEEGSGKLAGTVFALELRETSVATQPRKMVSFRRRVKATDGMYHDIETFQFPVGATGWLRKCLLPWLAEGLARVEACHRNEVDENRRAAQAQRAARTDDEKARDDETRRLYSEQYGKDRWNEAVKQAGRHRARAKRHGLTEHFTAAQWLNHAALANFRCPMCDADTPLETHHIHALASGGSNTIGNVQLLCAVCHIKVGGRGEDGGDEWLAAELEKCTLFQIGDHVKREWAYGPKATDRGVVLEAIPPKRGEGPLLCYRVPLSARNDMSVKLVPRRPLWCKQTKGEFIPTKMRVLWTRKKTGKTYKEDIEVTELVACPMPDPRCNQQES